MSSDVAIAVRGLTKEYVIAHEEKYTTLGEKMLATLKNPLHKPKTERFQALTDVSFDVKKGEVVGIIGRNGAGKSTLLKILSRITEPTAGEVKLFGRVGSLLEVGTGFHPELTGRENIFLNGAILGMTRAEIRKHFDEIVDFAEIEKFLDTPVKRYSSGMYVRLAFAVAAHLNPEILIVDEVLSVGDAEFQRKCLGKMQEVSRGEGRTVLFVSHNMAAVEALCHTGVLLEKGSLAMRDTSANVVERYFHSQKSATDRYSRRVFDRPASGASPWMKSAVVLCDGVESKTIPMGSALSLEVEFASDTGLVVPEIGFVIFAQHGMSLINANNQFLRTAKFKQPVKEGVTRCDLGAVPLVTGHYSVSLWFGRGGIDTHIEREALDFEVVERDLWETGRTPPPTDSLMWWPVTYRFRTPAGVEEIMVNDFSGQGTARTETGAPLS